MLDGKEKSKRAKTRRKANNGSLIPSGVVCSSNELFDRPGAIELGVLLCLVIMGIYLFGFFESFMSLPDANFPEFYREDNFNVAHPTDRKNYHHVRTAKEPVKPQTITKKNPPAVVDQKVQKIFDEAAKKLANTPKTNFLPAAAPITPTIPKAKWPVTLRDEQDEYENLLHPGDEVTVMKVPKFWSPPVHHNQLMTRETALQIGSCIEPDENGNYNRGDQCPPDKRTIFVGIASYRDFECRSTAESIFLRAKHPERVRIAVVDQIVDGVDPRCDAPIHPCDEDPEQGLCKYKNQIDVYQMAAGLSVGPVFARHIGYRMYRGEYYATQSDAHVTYTQNWDADIIEQFEVTKNEMAVLSTYLTDVQGSIDENGHSLRHTRPIMCNTIYEGGSQGMHLRHGSQPERKPSIVGSPQLQPWWAAGYSFSRGHFVVNVPYDWKQVMIFQGEEMSIGIRGFTIGYDFYAPERSVCFHHYAVGNNAKVRNKVHHFWENTKYSGMGRRAMARLLGMVHMNPEVPKTEWDHDQEDIYGIGQVRTPEKFYQTFGIDVVHKTVQRHLCRFVDAQGKMHNEFTPFLRSDGMGIDYSRINYEFVDPAPNEK